MITYLAEHGINKRYSSFFCLLTCPLVIPFLFCDSLFVFLFSKLTTLFLCHAKTCLQILVWFYYYFPEAFFKFLLSLARYCQSVNCCLTCVLVTVYCSGKCEHTEDQKIMMSKSIPILQLPLASMTFLTKTYLMLYAYSEDTIKEIPVYPLTIRTWIWITGADQR